MIWPAKTMRSINFEKQGLWDWHVESIVVFYYSYVNILTQLYCVYMQSFWQCLCITVAWCLLFLTIKLISLIVSKKVCFFFSLHVLEHKQTFATILYHIFLKWYLAPADIDVKKKELKRMSKSECVFKHVEETNTQHKQISQINAYFIMCHVPLIMPYILLSLHLILR